jgi:hypothetical protein
MVLPQQREIYDYWRRKCRGECLPSADDIKPEELASQLSMVTLTEPVPCDVNPGAKRYFYRLAGTGFWRFYDQEIQGRFVDELPIGCRADYWHRVLDMVVTHRRPYHGVTKPNTPIGSHMAQFWIRLPLSADGDRVDTILGYDYIAPLEQAVAPLQAQKKVFA